MSAACPCGHAIAEHYANGCGWCICKTPGPAMDSPIVDPRKMAAIDPAPLRDRLVERIAAAFRDYRRIPDAGDGFPSFRSGDDRDMAEIAVKVAQEMGWTHD